MIPLTNMQDFLKACQNLYEVALKQGVHVQDIRTVLSPQSWDSLALEAIHNSSAYFWPGVEFIGRKKGDRITYYGFIFERGEDRCSECGQEKKP
jgi:hypothetical protein